MTSRDSSKVTEDGGHLPRVKNPWSSAGWPGTGLQHHQPIVHFSQKLWIYSFSNVGDLVWICSYVIDFYEHLEAERKEERKKQGLY